MPSVRIDGEYLAAQVLTEVARKALSLKAERSIIPGLALILLGDDPVQAMYVQKKLEAAAGAGILARRFNLPGYVTEPALLALLEKLNRDNSFHGVFVQLPLSEGIDINLVSRAIDPAKDVDCMHPLSIGKLLSASDSLPPAIVAAVREVLARGGLEVAGRRVVICAKAGAVASPVLLAAVLQSTDCAAVTLCSPATPDLMSITSQADILITGVGIPLFVQPDMVKQGATVIDTGQNVLPVTGERRTAWRTVGDVDFARVSSKAGAITPVPGGIGPMVIAMLLANTLEAARRLTGAGAADR